MRNGFSFRVLTSTCVSMVNEKWNKTIPFSTVQCSIVCWLSDCANIIKSISFIFCIRLSFLFILLRSLFSLEHLDLECLTIDFACSGILILTAISRWGMLPWIFIFVSVHFHRNSRYQTHNCTQHATWNRIEIEFFSFSLIFRSFIWIWFNSMASVSRIISKVARHHNYVWLDVSVNPLLMLATDYNICEMNA